MTIIKRNRDLMPSVPSFFDDFWTKDLFDLPRLGSVGERTSMPAVNIKENEDMYMVEVAAPGMNKKDFKVELDNGILTISAEMKVEGEDKNNEYTRREFSYRSFQRSFTLPEDVVDEEKIEAKYNDGVLNIHIPKREEVKPKPVKTIKIG